MPRVVFSVPLSILGLMIRAFIIWKGLRYWAYYHLQSSTEDPRWTSWFQYHCWFLAGISLPECFGWCEKYWRRHVSKCNFTQGKLPRRPITESIHWSTTLTDIQIPLYVAYLRSRYRFWKWSHWRNSDASQKAPETNQSPNARPCCPSLRDEDSYSPCDCICCCAGKTLPEHSVHDSLISVLAAFCPF